MRARATAAAVVITCLSLWTWRTQLFTVSRPGDRPRALEARSGAWRTPTRLDVVLPVVPIGLDRLRPEGQVFVIHYWAPWERHGAIQAALLDSLRHLDELDGMRVALVCFDPYPSVARYVARHRLRLDVLLDTRRILRRSLPCPSVPYTYVLDRNGRIAVAQPGEVDWLSPQTRAALRGLLAEPGGYDRIVNSLPAHGEGRALAPGGPGPSRLDARRRDRMDFAQQST
jgi:hypothetical protein